MALKMVKGSIDRMFDKNLQDLVRGIRNHKEDEVSLARRRPGSARRPTLDPGCSSPRGPAPGARAARRGLGAAHPRPPRASVYPRGPKAAPDETPEAPKLRLSHSPLSASVGLPRGPCRWWPPIAASVYPLCDGGPHPPPCG